MNTSDASIMYHPDVKDRPLEALYEQRARIKEVKAFWEAQAAQYERENYSARAASCLDIARHCFMFMMELQTDIERLEDDCA